MFSWHTDRTQSFPGYEESSSIHAVEHVVIYRFSSNLCFANVSVLQKDIEDAIREDTRAVILDAEASGVLILRRQTVWSGFMAP